MSHRITDFKTSSTKDIVSLDKGFHFSNDFFVTLKSRIRSVTTGIPDDLPDFDLIVVSKLENNMI